jgi:CubicO group peptidase (beta-lactamase class C family)
VVAVTQGSREIADGAYGLASINHDVLLDRRSILRIGSQSKQFTVLLLLMLEAEGRLSMDEVVQDYLPWVPRFAHSITLRHLASNTSGLRDHFEALTFSGRSIFAPSTRRDAREVIARQDELNFAPGTEMIYSNGGFVVLSELIERIADAPFGDVLKQRITGPLGMSDTRLMATDREVGPRLATHYSSADGGWQHLTWGVVLGGEGGMVSTLDDMLLWQANLRRPQVGTPDMYERMATPTRYVNGTLSPYGLGLVCNAHRGMRAVGHGGSVAGGRSESVRFLDADVGIIILANTDAVAPYSLARRIADHHLGARLLSLRNPDEVAQLTEAAGIYREVDGNDVFEILGRGGEPFLLTSSGSLQLEQVGPNLFRPETGIMDLTLRLTKPGTIEAIWCGTKRCYQHLSDSSTPRLGRFSGRYVQRGLDLQADVTDTADGLRLAIRSPLGALRADLRQIDEDLCLLRLTDEMNLRLDRPWLATVRFDAGGFVLNSDRTKKLLFARSDVP